VVIVLYYNVNYSLINYFHKYFIVKIAETKISVNISARMSGADFIMIP